MSAQPDPGREHAGALAAWAHGYLARYGWVLAPVWEGRSDGGCRCPEGSQCPRPGKHLVVELGQARDAADVERVWGAGAGAAVLSGAVGIAALCGPDSGLLALDVDHPDNKVLAAQLRLDGDVLAQTTPSGGAHWLFGMDRGESVVGGAGRGEPLDVWPGARVIADGGFIVLAPRPGYAWSGGAEAVRSGRGWRPMPEGLRRVLEQQGLLTARGAVDVDSAWMTLPGVPMLSVGGGMAMRSLKKRGFARRVVDLQGHRITWTPGIGFRVWTESGWADGDRAQQQLESFANDDLAAALWNESEAQRLAGDGDGSRATLRAKSAAANAGVAGILALVRSDERILVPSLDEWDKDPELVGLPVVRGRGWLLNLRTGGIEHDARTRRVTGQLGAEWSGWEDGAAAWARAEAVPKIVRDLEQSQGPDWIRLMQRSLGVSLLGSGVRTENGQGAGDGLFVLQGPTRSGKSTLLEAFLAVAGSYGKAMSENVLFGDRGNPDFALAGLIGKRVLTLSEPPLNAELNTTRLKQLTGGDTVTGRPPYGSKEVTFRVEGSCWLTANHPIAAGTDDAVWERLRIFQFSTQWVDGRGDPTLRDRAVGDAVERAALLYWLLAGLRDWFREGWGGSELWDRTREEMRLRHDPMARWLTTSGAVAVTGVHGDTVRLQDAVTAARMWLYAVGEEKASKADPAVLTEEIKHRMVRAGATWDSHASLLRGVRLI